MDADRIRRVLMTADTVGGVWTHALELARGLAARGIGVHLATMGALPSEGQRAAASVPGIVLHASAYRLEWMENPWRSVGAAGDWLLALEARIRPTIVHLNQFTFGALPFTAPTLVVGHSCVLSWWRAVHGSDAPREWDRYRAAVRAGLACATLVGAPSAAMLAALRVHHGFDADGRVLPNGRSASDFAPAIEKDAVVLAAGRLWDAAKNVAALEAVAPRLRWPIRVAGAAQRPGGATRTTAGVVALGALTPAAFAAELSGATIFAAPARYEPFGQATLEAALAGCALVLGDIESQREIWDEAALFVDPDDHDALHSALAALIDAPQRCRRLAAAARTRALAFSPRRMVDGYLAAYRWVAHGAPAGAGIGEVVCAS
ncbi:MAG: glycosyltransferase family 4 protein [Rhizobacter sp.]|nr:glycosyltransferase family 4 protein [Rhizobacter sp.]